MVLNDWQRGKLPFFVPPPGCHLEPNPEDDDGEEMDFEVSCSSKAIYSYNASPFVRPIGKDLYQVSSIRNICLDLHS